MEKPSEMQKPSEMENPSKPEPAPEAQKAPEVQIATTSAESPSDTPPSPKPSTSNLNKFLEPKPLFTYLSKSANDLHYDLNDPLNSGRPINLSNPMTLKALTGTLPRSYSAMISKISSPSIDSSNPSSSTTSSCPSSTSINSSFLVQFTSNRTYTYPGSHGAPKSHGSGKRRGFYTIIRRYSDSEESIVRTIIEDIDLSRSATPQDSAADLKAAHDLDSIDLNPALFIRELTRSITMGPVIPGIQTTQPPKLPTVQSDPDEDM